MKNMTATRRFEFCYAHSLVDYDGKCANVHGHNAVVEFTFLPYPEEEYEGMVVDFGKIKEVIEPIIEKLDHKNLNETILFFSLEHCTAENIVLWLVNTICNTELGPYLKRVKFYETSNCFIEWEA